MEPDRYAQSRLSFIIGMISMIVTLCLIAFTGYITPYLLFGWQYHVPEFIYNWKVSMMQYYQYSDMRASWAVFGIFFILTVMAGIIAWLSSNYIDNQIHGVKRRGPREISRESLALFLRILLIVLFVFMISRLFHWIISR